MKVKNVLSIDMDYIVHECIFLYNNLIGEENYETGEFWEKYEYAKDLENFIFYSEKAFSDIKELFEAQLRKVPCENFFFAEEHDMILEFLCREDKRGEAFNVYNIDHHHDIYYCPEQKSEIDRFDYACLANWVYYLGKNGKIQKYYWAGNRKSVGFPREEKSNLMFPFDSERYCEDIQGLGVKYSQ